MLEPKDYQDHMRGYLAALAAGDGAEVARHLSDSVIWHVGGLHPLSGRYEGREKVAAVLGTFKERSGGTVRLDPSEPMFNDNLAAINLQFTAQRPGKFMSMNGIDVFRLGPGGIEEVWLFSTHQDAEDVFWGD